MRNSLLLKILIIFSFIVLGFQKTYSQDMSNVKVNELTDTQIRNFILQVEAAGLSEEQLEQVAQSKGMADGEVQKLRKRIDELKAKKTSSSGNSVEGNKTERQGRIGTGDSTSYQQPRDKRSEAEKALEELKTKIFGASLFKNSNPQFEPNLNIATPKNYIIGTGDELMLDIYGDSEVSYKLKVSPEGSITVPYVGVISVGGATIEATTSRIKNKLSTVYSGLNNGRTQVDITLSNIRSIKVILSGELVQPGTYTLPSIATVFNALYSSGGPTENGSLRDIQVIRNGKKIASLDVYDFLMRGSLTNNITLQDQDVIYVPAYLTRVELSGQVKRNALFEIKPGETFKDLLNYAGGFTENAYEARIKVIKTTGTEKRIEDLLASQFRQYEPKSGDKFTIEEILSRFENRVTINGSVYRPGDYELSPGLTVSMLIKKAAGVKEDAFLNRGYIIRLKSNLETEQLSFNIADVLAGTAPDVELKREDIIQISSLFDLRDKYIVTIQGEVREPDTFSYSQEMSLGSLIQMAGGFKVGASPNRIEIARRIKNADITSVSAVAAEVLTININPDLSLKGGDVILQPFDIVSIRKASGYEVQAQVKLEGEVIYPGVYTITNKDERISDVIKRAGGLTVFAYAEGGSLTRPGKETQEKEFAAKRQRQLAITALGTDNEQDIENWIAQEKVKVENEQKMANMRRLSEGVDDVGFKEVDLQQIVSSDLVGINLNKILHKPNSRTDLLLQDGDIINIPKTLQTVKVNGEVLRPNNVVYHKGRGFKTYVNAAGGYTQYALKKGSYIQYANGSVDATSKILFFKNYPEVKPGSEIFVPKREPREKLSAQGWVGISSAIVSMAVMIFTLVR